MVPLEGDEEVKKMNSNQNPNSKHTMNQTSSIISTNKTLK